MNLRRPEAGQLEGVSTVDKVPDGLKLLRGLFYRDVQHARIGHQGVVHTLEQVGWGERESS